MFNFHDSVVALNKKSVLSYPNILSQHVKKKCLVNNLPAGNDFVGHVPVLAHAVPHHGEPTDNLVGITLIIESSTIQL